MAIQLTPKTDQEAFDVAVRRLYDGTGPAGIPEPGYEDSMLCKYRLPKDDGTVLKCVVGEMISDDEYTPSIEGSPVGVLVSKWGFNTGGINIRLLESLQTAHDSRPHWDGSRFANPSMLRVIAERYNLDASLVDELAGTQDG